MRMVPQLSKNSLGAYREPRCDDEGNLCVVAPSSGLPFRFFLTSVGDGTGTYNLIGDYSAAPTDFFYQATSRFEIYTLAVTISDASKFNQEFYGGIAAGLTNGIRFYFKYPSGVEVPIIISSPVKANYQWIEVASRANLTSFDGTAQTFQIMIGVHELFGKPFTLAAGERVLVRLNDNFTGLVGHTFRLHGTLF